MRPSASQVAPARWQLVSIPFTAAGCTSQRKAAEPSAERTVLWSFQFLGITDTSLFHQESAIHRGFIYRLFRLARRQLPSCTNQKHVGQGLRRADKLQYFHLANSWNKASLLNQAPIHSPPDTLTVPNCTACRRSSVAQLIMQPLASRPLSVPSL